MSNEHSGDLDRFRQLAAAVHGSSEPEQWDLVSDGSRWVVLRGPGGIAKCARDPLSNAAAYELEGLRYLTSTHRGLGPELLGADAANGVVLIEDFGPGRSLADALLGIGPHEAEKALDLYVDALVELHTETARVDIELGRTWLDELLSAALESLRSASNPLPVLPHSVDEAVFDELLRRPAIAVFSFGDMCPDNNVIVDGKMRFFDLEGSGWVHPAIDLANLTVPFPSCWCSFGLPTPVTERAVRRYRDAAPDESVVELHRAHELFALLGLGLAFDRADRDTDALSERGVPLPTSRERLTARVGLAASSGPAGHPLLREWFVQTADWLTTRWSGHTRVPLAPAFR